MMAQTDLEEIEPGSLRSGLSLNAVMIEDYHSSLQSKRSRTEAGAVDSGTYSHRAFPSLIADGWPCHF